MAERVWRPEAGSVEALKQLEQLEQLEQENGRLRMALAELTLEKIILKEAASGSVWSAPPQQGTSW